MKSLFTRVFLAYWLSLLFAAGLSALVTTRNFTGPTPPDNARLAREAQKHLNQGGVTELRRWAARLNAGQDLPVVHVFDDAGHDIGGGPGPVPMLIAAGPGPMEARIANEAGQTFTVIAGPRGRFESPFSRPERYLLIALAVIISAAGALWVAHSIGTPIRSLQSLTQRLAAGNLSLRPDVTLMQRADELGSLSRAFDNMAERMSTLVTGHQHLLRELSHEMRAPLARLRVALDLLDQQQTPQPRLLARASQEADRLEQLANGVLSYARMEQETGLRRREPVDVAALVGIAVHDVLFEMQLPESACEIDAGCGASVPGDAVLLQIAIENVLRNAVRYGGTSPAVQITVRNERERVVVQVRDHGPGVDAIDLPRLFKPFSRLHPPASQSTPGNGLGLAIVAQVMKLHGGHAHARNAHGGGLLVTLEIPLAPDADAQA